MKVYNYTIYFDDTEENKRKYTKDYITKYPYGKRGITPYIEESNTCFSSEEKAIEFAKKRIEEDDLKEEKAVLLFINEEEVDNNDHDSNMKVINLLNNQEYVFSWVKEYDHQDCLYKKGDWVYFLSNRKLQIGLIQYEAEGEEPYLITTENTSLSDCSTHDHVSESYIIRKMEEKDVKQILPNKFFSLIKQRYELHELRKKNKK